MDHFIVKYKIIKFIRPQIDAAVSSTIIGHSYDKLAKLNDNLACNTSIILSLPPNAPTDTGIEEWTKNASKYDDVYNEMSDLVASYASKDGDDISTEGGYELPDNEDEDDCGSWHNDEDEVILSRPMRNKTATNVKFDAIRLPKFTGDIENWGE